jgi:hypothetical protein
LFYYSFDYHFDLSQRHSRLNERKNNNKIIEKPIKLDLSNSYNTDQSKIEVVPLENALLNMNEILKNLTLNSNKKVRLNHFYSIIYLI